MERTNDDSAGVDISEAYSQQRENDFIRRVRDYHEAVVVPLYAAFGLPCPKLER